MFTDFHLHSEYSGDCFEPCEAMIESAISSGIKIMCITDHRDLDFPFDYNKYGRLDAIDYDEYFTHWNQLREKYASQIDIRIGIEAGIETTTAERQSALVNSYPFDFVISSVHAITWEYPHFDDLFARYGTHDVMDLYFRRILENLNCFLDFDVLGHIDFIARFAADKSGYVYDDHADIIDVILKKTISLGKGIEVNTAGYRKGMGCPNPVPEILSRYHELGGEIITAGSDAHHACDVASNFKEAEALLKEIGFKYICAYKDRKPEFISL